MPDEPPRALIAIVHGVTEHSGRYSALAQTFPSAQIGVCAFDLRGHGRSSGHRGHVDRWQDYTSDLDRFLRAISAAHPGIPIFLFGHSLGSLIVLSYVMEHSSTVRGAIVSGTAVEPVGIARPHLVVLARAFSLIWPTFSIPVRPKGRAVLSRDPKVETAFRTDPLVLKSMTARFGAQALAMIASVKRRAHSVRLPLLVIHGGADSLNTVAGAQQFFNEVDSADKQMIIYPGSYHEPHNDLDRDKVLADLGDWIERHL
jgi:alpha-beta hydrolase superfamily lysophospholipase